MHQATSIACLECGGEIVLTAERPHTECPFCGAGMQLREEVRRGTQRYESTARALLGQEALARRKAAMHARSARYNGPLIGLLILFAIVVTWWFVAGVSGVAAKISPLVNAGLVAFSVVQILLTGWMTSRVVSPPGDDELGSVGMAMCDNCGAFIAFEQGTALTACKYCHAHALKPSALALALLQSGQQAVHEGQAQAASAEAENWRTAQEAKVGGIRMGATGWAVVAVMSAFAMTGALVAGLVSPGSTTRATWWIWCAVVGATAIAITRVVRTTKQLIADNQVFERRFGVRIAEATQPRRPYSGPPMPAAIVNPAEIQRQAAKRPPS